MNKQWRCWFEYGAESFGKQIDACDADDAAEAYCDIVEEGGGFAGDPYPDPIEVKVRDLSDDALYLVEVEPSWSVMFYTRRSRRVDDACTGSESE